MLQPLKALACDGLHRCGAFSALRFMRRHQTLVLVYHGVLPADGATSPYLDYNFVPADRFEQQILHLRRHYRPVTLTEFLDARARRRRLPRRSVLVTFDDGFANNYRVAFPILKRHNVPFVVFLATGMIGRPGAQLWTERVRRSVYLSNRPAVDFQLEGHRCRFTFTTPSTREEASRALLVLLKRLEPAARDRQIDTIEDAFGRQPISFAERERYDFLTWEDARAMAAAGVEFGSHTVSHPILSTLDADALRRELEESRREIARQIGRCEAFAYPNGGPGDFGSRECAAVRAAGYRCAFAMLGGLVGSRSDPFALQRVNIGRTFTLPLFDAAATGLVGAARRARRAARRSRASTPDPWAPELERVG